MRPCRSSFLALALTLPAFALAAPPSAQKLSPALARALAEAPDGRAEMLIVLAAQADLAPARRLSSKAERGAFVYERLTETARRTQPELLAELARLGAPARPFWAANFVWTTGDRALAERLAARADVARLDTNPRLVLAPPERDPAGLDAPAAPGAIEWNLAWVNADDVWALGHTGQGAVVAGQDTGYQWDHPALQAKYRGWNGATADHDYNWHDAIHSGGGVCGADSPVPCDDDEHGTHTMGTMVGDDGGTNRIGMAPGAKWIGCRNMDQGVGTPVTYSECFEWFLAPTRLDGTIPDPSKAPDVINNSWGCPTSEGCNPDNFAVMQQVVENVRAAGIFVAVSAGNDGSSCSTVTAPAAIYDASFSVGATGDHSDSIAGFSSRGPVTVDGSNRMKPDISAPGSNIRSSTPGSTYQGGWDGTSMAGPHVAGLVGLLISAVPAAAGDVDRLEDVIRQSAVQPTFAGACGVAAGVFPNNTFGAGRIDALAAVQLLASQLDFTLRATPAQRAVCAPADAVYDLSIGQYGSYTDPVTLAVAGQPAGTTVGFSVNPVTPPGASVLTVGNTGAAAAGSYALTLTGTAPGPLEHDAALGLAIFAGAPGAPALSAPADGALNVAVRPAFSWAAAAGAESYLVEVDDDADFSSPVASATVAGTSHTPAADLPSNAPLFWRVTAGNPCATTPSASFHFTTVALPGDCATGTVPHLLFAAGFEAGAEGFTHAGTGDSWAVATANPYGGLQSFHANDPDAVSDQVLLSPSAGIALPAGENPVVLKFWHQPNLEPNGATACYDAGVVEVSADGGTIWAEVPAASVLIGPYRGAVSTCCSNPLAGRSAWCGATGYGRSVVDLSAWAGQTVRLHFRLGSDTSVTNPGWDVDDLEVQSCLAGIFVDGFEAGGTSAWSLASN